jgi:hypothetical protein
MENKKVIVRCDKAGVFYGELIKKTNNEVILKNVRKLYHWSGAAAVEQLSVDGVRNPNNCKFTITVNEMIVSNWIQILPCTEKSIKSIEGVEAWRV